MNNSSVIWYVPEAQPGFCKLFKYSSKPTITNGKNMSKMKGTETTKYIQWYKFAECVLGEKQVSAGRHIVIGFSKQSTHSADAFSEHLSHVIIHLETGNQQRPHTVHVFTYVIPGVASLFLSKRPRLQKASLRSVRFQK